MHPDDLRRLALKSNDGVLRAPALWALPAQPSQLGRLALVNDLAQRIEQASAEQQREMLEEAWLAKHHGGYGPEGVWDDCDLCTGFVAMLDAQAWLSAAEMLVPSGLEWRVGHFEDGCCEAEIWIGHVELRSTQTCSTPALALAPAALRAHISENPDAG